MMYLTRKSVRATSRSVRCKALCAAFVVGALVLLSWTPEAQAIPRILRPGTNPWVFLFGFGPSLNMHTSVRRYYSPYDRYDYRYDPYYSDRYYRSYSSSLHQFKLQQDIGAHFSGDAEGPALGASMEEAFGNDYFRFEVGPKFWWDIKPVDDLGLYIAPEARIGFGMMTNPFDPYFNLQTGVSGRLMLDDRWVVFLKPIGLNFDIGNEFYLYWEIMLGGGVTW